jgi:hypothetical protein
MATRCVCDRDRDQSVSQPASSRPPLHLSASFSVPSPRLPGSFVSTVGSICRCSFRAILPPSPTQFTLNGEISPPVPSAKTRTVLPFPFLASSVSRWELEPWFLLAVSSSLCTVSSGKTKHHRTASIACLGSRYSFLLGQFRRARPSPA